MERSPPAPDRRRLYPEATEEEWRDWRWQMRHLIRAPEQIPAAIRLTEEERRGLAETSHLFRLGISPYYASLIDPEHPFCPIRMQAIPVASEARVHPGELRDPLGEDKTRPVPSIVHRYPDRVLFLLLDQCSVYCRHCTRRRITHGEEGVLDRSAAEAGLAYLAAHPEVRDVLLSGGDPLLLGTERLAALLERLRAIPHLELIRIGTRVPVTLPMRIDDRLASALRRAAPLFVVTHFNHPKEVTPLAREACERLVDHGVPVENQAVLLRRVNSEARTIRDLCHRMLAMRVRPYYLHQADVAEGIEHLRTPLAKGIEILERMRGWTSGLAVPHLAVDLPGGGGKVTLQPNYILSTGERDTLLRNYRGELYRYPEPAERDCACPYDEVYYGNTFTHGTKLPVAGSPRPERSCA